MSGEMVEKLVKEAVQQLDHFVDSVVSELSKELQDGVRLKTCCVSCVSTLRRICEMTIDLLKHVAAQTKLYPSHVLSLQRLAGLVNITFGLLKFVVLTMFVQMTMTAIKLGKTIKQRVKDGVRLASSTEEPADDAAVSESTASDGTSPTITAEQMSMAKAAMAKLDAEVATLSQLIAEAGGQLNKNSEIGGQLKVVAEKIETSKEKVAQLATAAIDVIRQLGHGDDKKKPSLQDKSTTSSSHHTAPEDLVPLAEETIAKLDGEVVELSRMIEEACNVQTQTPPATDTERKEAREQLKAIGKKVSASKDEVDNCFAKICKTKSALEEQVRALFDEEIFKKGAEVLKVFGIEVEVKEVNLAFMVVHVNPLESLLKTFKGFKGTIKGKKGSKKSGDD